MYKHVLLASDLSSSTNSVAVEAVRQAKNSNAMLSIVCVLEPIATYGFPIVADHGVEKLKQAEESLKNMCAELKIPMTNTYIRSGSPKNEVLSLAEELDVDLIVVGSHGRHGISKFLGSTASAILHGSNCSVLVSRVTNELT